MIVDVHGHVTSPTLFERLPMPPALADVGGMIERKAAAGITTTLVGSPVGAGTMVPLPGWDNYAQPVDQIEAFHDWVAETVRAHPGALKGYVYTNPYGGAALLAEADRRLTQPEFVGLIVNTSTQGRYLNEPAAEEFFALAARHRAPVLLHAPAEPIGAAGLAHVGLVEHVARPCDVTLGVAAVLAARWLDKYPDLRLMASTAGGALALLKEKLDLAEQRAAAAGTVPDGASPLSAGLRRIYVDTATPSRLALGGAVEAFGVDRMLFGTDSPPLTAPPQASVDLVRSLPLSERDRDRVLYGTAAELFGLTAPAPAPAAAGTAAG